MGSMQLGSYEKSWEVMGIHCRPALADSIAKPAPVRGTLDQRLINIRSNLLSLFFILLSLVFVLLSLFFHFLVFGLWSLFSGLLSFVSCLWSLVFYLSSLVSGLWSLVFYLSSLVSGLYSLVFGLWSLSLLVFISLPSRFSGRNAIRNIPKPALAKLNSILWLKPVRLQSTVNGKSVNGKSVNCKSVDGKL